MKICQQTASSLLNSISYLEEAIQHFTVLCEQRFVDNRTREIQAEIEILESKKALVLKNAVNAPATLAKMKPELLKAKQALEELKERKEERKNGVQRKPQPKTLEQKLEKLYEMIPSSIKNNFASKGEALEFLKEFI